MGQHLPTKAKTESHGKLLIVPDVEQEDGGKYMCKAKNTVGEVVHYFTVTVEGIFLPEPNPEENIKQLSQLNDGCCAVICGVEELLQT